MKGLVLPNPAAFLQKMGIAKLHQPNHRTSLSNAELYEMLDKYAQAIQELNQKPE